jgi:L-ascorbate metabolism protein UlaG (beta-lactamase superfamily)
MTFLFDYPDDTLLSPELIDLVYAEINDTDLYVICSHSHDDHYNSDVNSLRHYARKVRYILSEDIQDLYPDTVPQDSLIVEPEDTYSFDELTILTLPSNDLGVAFLISVQEKNIYYGGDLANWCWPNMPQQAQEVTAQFFRECLESLQEYDIHIAFSNVDKRLDNMAGGVQCIEILKPHYFVPMHTFGNIEWIEDFQKKIEIPQTHIFQYSSPGDTFYFEL